MKIKKCFWFALMIICLAPLHAAFAAPAKVAPDIASKCTITVSSTKDEVKGPSSNLTDGKHGTAWTAEKSDEQYIQISLPEGQSAAGVYIMWNTVPKDWSLLESTGGSIWSITDLKDKANYINTYIPLGSKTVKFRIETNSFDWEMSVAEIKVFGSGTLPENVQVWQPSPKKADLMVIPAHPDDELIYLGGTLPYYAGQLGKHTIVVYMTSSPIIRKFEALDGLWKVGVHEYPIFLPLQNKYTTTLKDAEDSWEGLDNSVGMLVEQIRRFKPDVIVTHDLNGEYGHGAHMLTALSTEKAVEDSGNSAIFSKSADQYGVWKVKKCYLHLYPDNQIEMNWNQPLSAFGGKTALEMAREGYELHVSQHFHDRPIIDYGPYDNAKYGLFYSSVGLDTTGKDFFENVTPRPTTTPEPTATMTPVPTQRLPQASSTAVIQTQANAKNGNIKAEIVIPIILVFLLLGIAFAKFWKDQNIFVKSKHSRK